VHKPNKGNAEMGRTGAWIGGNRMLNLKMCLAACGCVFVLAGCGLDAAGSAATAAAGKAQELKQVAPVQQQVQQQLQQATDALQQRQQQTDAAADSR